MARRITIDVTFPRTGKTHTFYSVASVARMLSGNGTASGGLRSSIVRKATNGVFGDGPSIVRRNTVYG